MIQGRKTCATDSGMWGVWDCKHFSGVRDYDTWEAELLEDADILRHVRAGHFVPINLNTDGAFEIEVRVGETGAPASLAARERSLLTVASADYLLRATGEGIVCFGGIEHVGWKPALEVGRVRPSVGDYAVRVHLINWSEEPGTKGPDGHPTPTALPDFLVLLNPTEPGFMPAATLQTFPPPRD